MFPAYPTDGMSMQTQPSEGGAWRGRKGEEGGGEKTIPPAVKDGVHTHAQTHTHTPLVQAGGTLIYKGMSQILS